MSNKQTLLAATILLVDNGSSRVDSTLGLRRIAQALSNKTDLEIHAVSLQHANHIPEIDVQEKLQGVAANVFSAFLTEQLTQGQRQFIIIPLFFGESSALSSFIPDEIAKLETRFGTIQWYLKEVLYPVAEGDSFLVDILYQHVISIIKSNRDNLVLVDHGSPNPAVTKVRQQIAVKLKDKLQETHSGLNLDQAVMERRRGEEYDFNGTLLKDYLCQKAESGATHVAVLLLFLLPGSHAGKDGDITQICNEVKQRYPNMDISISPLVGDNPVLIDCLEQRLLNLTT